MSVRHDHEHERTETHDVTTPTNTHNKGLALCLRVTLDSVAHRWVPARTPTVHRCPKREGRGWPDKLHDKTDRPHDKDKSQDKRAFSETKC